MTIFAGNAPALDRRTILDVPAEAGDIFSASFSSFSTTNPSVALNRFEELNQQEQGRAMVVGPESYMVPDQGRMEPETPVISAQDARDRVDSLGLQLKIPEQGIRQGALDVLIQRHQEQAAFQQVQARAGNSMGIQLLAGLAASLLDPLNIASAFVPVVGEARVSALLAGASGGLARAGVRAGVGAIEGSVGAALVEPLPLMAAAQDQTDYTLSNSLANIAFGALLGGGLHSVGGAVSDRLKRSIIAGDDAAPTAAGLDTSPSVAGASRVGDPVAEAATRSTGLQDFARAFDNDPIDTLRTSLARQLQDDHASLRTSAEARAIDEIMPTLSGERIGNVADLKAARIGLSDQLEGLDATFRDRAKAFQGEGLSRKQAESAARRSIATERDQLGAEVSRIDSTLDMNRQGEFNRADLNALKRGKVPDRLRPLIDARASQIMEGYQQRPLGPAMRTAREQAEDADWTVRESALKSAVAQAMSGREINVQSIFDAQDPAKAAGAMDNLRRGPSPYVDTVAQNDSARADTVVKSQRDDLTTAQQDFADEQALVDEMLGQLPAADRLAVERSAAEETEQAAMLAQKAEQYSKAYRAAAICDLRNGV